MTDSDHINKLTTKIAKILFGKEPAIQSAALANLVALGLAQHPDEAARKRARLLFIELVDKLIPFYAEAFKPPPAS